jgi:hypothetical protein
VGDSWCAACRHLDVVSWTRHAIAASTGRNTTKARWSGDLLVLNGSGVSILSWTDMWLFGCRVTCAPGSTWALCLCCSILADFVYAPCWWLSGGFTLSQRECGQCCEHIFILGACHRLFWVGGSSSLASVREGARCWEVLP